MKIQGQAETRYRRTFTFENLKDTAGCPLCIEVEPLPYGFDETMNKRIGRQPLPPRVMTGKNDKGEFVYRENPEAPAFRDQMAEWQALAQVGQIYESIHRDERVTFDAPKELLETAPREFYAKIADEIKAAGWTLVDVTRLNRMIAKDVQDAMEGVDDAKRELL